MAQVYKIAVIQLYPKPMDIEGNYAKAVQFIRDAASQGADLAVLPEYHLFNWVPSDPKFAILCAEYQTYLDNYCSLAKELNINIVPGTIVEKHDDTLLNVAYWIKNTGEMIGKYQKKNLWHPERSYLTSSSLTPHLAFDTPLGKVGMLICWDLAFPEAFRELVSQGAKIIILPTFWNLSDCTPEGLAYNPLSEKLFLESTITARCFENTCAVVFCNAGGPVGKVTEGTFAGLSQVAVPLKGPLEEMGAEEGMIVVDLDMKILEVAEDNYKVRADMGKEDWHYAYSLKRDAIVDAFIGDEEKK